MSEILSTAVLRRLVDGWIAQGKRVAGPRRIDHEKAQPLILYSWLDSSDQLVMDGFVHPGNSIKEFVFPRHEQLYAYRGGGKQIELVDIELPTTEQIIVGSRPCDAASLAVLDRVFNWDYQDALYNRRRQLTTIVTLACREHGRRLLLHVGRFRAKR